MKTIQFEDVKVKNIKSDFFNFKSEEGMLISEISRYSEGFGIAFKDNKLTINKQGNYNITYSDNDLLIQKN